MLRLNAIAKLVRQTRFDFAAGEPARSMIRTRAQPGPRFVLSVLSLSFPPSSPPSHAHPTTAMSSSSAINFDRTVGHEQPSQPVSWNRKDLLLYNVAIGAKADQLEYLYEKTDAFRPLPTYPLVLALKGDSPDINDFATMIGGRGALPGFPVLDPNTLVHAEQTLELHRRLPLVASPGEGWHLRKKITAVHDKKSGLILEGTAVLCDPVGREYATMVSSSFYRGGGQGTGYSKSLSAESRPPAGSPPKDGRKPDFSLTEATTPNQAVLYRLAGDSNPLHVDPAIGQRGGLGGVILHGLCSYGFATRAILLAANSHDGQLGQAASTLRRISGRFTSPVRPGDELRTDVWVLKGKLGKVGETCEVAFEQTNTTTGKKSLGGGWAELRVEEAERVASRL